MGRCAVGMIGRLGRGYVGRAAVKKEEEEEEEKKKVKMNDRRKVVLSILGHAAGSSSGSRSSGGAGGGAHPRHRLAYDRQMHRDLCLALCYWQRTVVYVQTIEKAGA